MQFGLHLLLGLLLARRVPKLWRAQTCIAAAYGLWCGSIAPDLDVYAEALAYVAGYHDAASLHRTLFHSVITAAALVAIVAGAIALLQHRGGAPAIDPALAPHVDRERYGHDAAAEASALPLLVAGIRADIPVSGPSTGAAPAPALPPDDSAASARGAILEAALPFMLGWGAGFVLHAVADFFFWIAPVDLTWPLSVWGLVPPVSLLGGPSESWPAWIGDVLLPAAEHGTMGLYFSALRLCCAGGLEAAASDDSFGLGFVPAAISSLVSGSWWRRWRAALAVRVGPGPVPPSAGNKGGQRGCAAAATRLFPANSAAVTRALRVVAVAEALEYVYFAALMAGLWQASPTATFLVVYGPLLLGSNVAAYYTGVRLRQCALHPRLVAAAWARPAGVVALGLLGTPGRGAV
jgi:hypothetical protein